MPRPGRLLFVCHYLHHVVGGAEIIGHKVLAGLRDAGWAVDAVALPGPHPAPSDRHLSWNLPLGLLPGSLRGKQVAIYAGGLGIDASACRQIARQLDPASYRAVIAHDTVSAGVGWRLAGRLGIPLVQFVYEPLPRATPPASGLAGWILGRLTARSNRVMHAALLGADVRIAASADTAARLDRFAPGRPTRVVYNSVPIPTISGSWTYGMPDLTRPETPSGSGNESGDRLLFVGRLSREKGFDLLVAAYERSRFKPPLSIASLDGPLATEAQALARRYPHVRLLEPVPPSGMPAVYARHTVVVAPSVWPDPLPGAVLEARAFGRALIVSNQGGIPEIVEGYRRVRMVDVSRPRDQVVDGLAAAIDTAGGWSALEPDEQAEAAFRARHDPRAQIDAILEAVASAVDRSRTS